MVTDFSTNKHGAYFKMDVDIKGLELFTFITDIARVVTQIMIGMRYIWTPFTISTEY